MFAPMCLLSNYIDIIVVIIVVIFKHRVKYWVATKPKLPLISFPTPT